MHSDDLTQGAVANAALSTFCMEKLSVGSADRLVEIPSVHGSLDEHLQLPCGNLAIEHGRL